MRRLFVLVLLCCGATANADRHYMHHGGVQIGSANWFTPIYRFSPVRFLELEVGLIAPPHHAAATAGLLIYPLRFEHYQIYLGGGASVFADQAGVRQFFYGRVGVAHAFHGGSRIAFDVGFWRGRDTDSETDRTKDFLWPMLGFSYTYGF